MVRGYTLDELTDLLKHFIHTTKSGVALLTWGAARAAVAAAIALAIAARAIAAASRSPLCSPLALARTLPPALPTISTIRALTILTIIAINRLPRLAIRFITGRSSHRRTNTRIE